MRYVFIFVEGNTDRALIEILLQRCLGFKLYENIMQMPEFMIRHVPKYPGLNGNLSGIGRPAFMYKDDTAVMISITNGKEGAAVHLARRLKAISISGREKGDSIAVCLIHDRDLELADNIILQDVGKRLAKEKIILQHNKIEYDINSYEFFFHVIPDKKCGAVESILLDLLEKSHKELVEEAHKYRVAVETKEEYAGYRRDWASSEGIQRLYADKVQVGAISAVLKPDSSPAIMLKDKLFSKDNARSFCGIESVKRIVDFLEKVMKEWNND